MTWQPIETAPKDGSWFLASPVDGQTITARWRKNMVREFVPVENGLYEARERDLGHFETGKGFFSHNICPTHWMPLPPPPRE